LCIKRLPCALPSVLQHLDSGSATFNNVDKTNLEEVRAVIEDFNKVAAPYAKLWKGQTNPAFESWSQDRADVDLLTIICTLSFSRSVDFSVLFISLVWVDETIIICFGVQDQYRCVPKKARSLPREGLPPILRSAVITQKRLWVRSIT
ncbi:hypothetical protein COOONC_28129, partial [Cooperia oncophora]